MIRAELVGERDVNGGAPRIELGARFQMVGRR